jgi:uroporphyrinogen decarboxylase-like protein
LNARERYVETLSFGCPDRAYFFHAYGVMPGVLERWQSEGLPPEVTAQEISDYFGLDPAVRRVDVNLSLDPPFETEILEETEEYILQRQPNGQVTQIYRAMSTLPHAIAYPVEEPQDWLQIRERMQFSMGRFASDWIERAKRDQEEGVPLVASAPGFYWTPRGLLGDERLCVWYYEHPDVVRDMVETYGNLQCAIAEEITAHVTVDEVHLYEDMAYRGGSIIGPGIFREFLLPAYRRFFDIFRARHTRIRSIDSDGRVDGLIPLFLEAGVNAFSPMEVRAGNDTVALRREYGTRMAYSGGVDKLVLPLGREAIDRELVAKIPFLLEQGGYLPTLDHRVVVETSLAQFAHYVRRVRELTGAEGLAARVPHSDPAA